MNEPCRHEVLGLHPLAIYATDHQKFPRELSKFMRAFVLATAGALALLPVLALDNGVRLLTLIRIVRSCFLSFVAHAAKCV